MRQDKVLAQPLSQRMSDALAAFFTVAAVSGSGFAVLAAAPGEGSGFVASRFAGLAATGASAGFGLAAGVAGAAGCSPSLRSAASRAIRSASRSRARRTPRRRHESLLAVGHLDNVRAARRDRHQHPDRAD